MFTEALFIIKMEKITANHYSVMPDTTKNFIYMLFCVLSHHSMKQFKDGKTDAEVCW